MGRTTDYNHEYYIKNREKLRAYKHEWYEKNKKRILAHQKEYNKSRRRKKRNEGRSSRRIEKQVRAVRNATNGSPRDIAQVAWDESLGEGKHGYVMSQTSPDGDTGPGTVGGAAQDGPETGTGSPTLSFGGKFVSKVGNS